MTGLTNAEAKSTLDARFPTTGATDHIAYSANGTTETTALARTPIGATGWGPATTADPAVKSNAVALTSATATGTATLSHSAIFTAATGGTQRTDWEPLRDPGTGNPITKPITPGDQITWAVGAQRITLT